MLIFVRFNLNFTVVSNEWSLGKCKDINYFVCLELSFHDSSYSPDINFPQGTAFSLSPHSSVFCCKQRGKIINSKNYTTLEQDFVFKKVS